MSQQEAGHSGLGSCDSGCVKFAAILLVVASGCGSVANEKPDARPPDSSMPDMAIDAPNAIAPGAVSAHSVNTFAAAGSAFTKVVFKTEDYDDRGEYDATTGRFTAKFAGDYLVCSSVYVPNTLIELDIYKNSVRGRAFAFTTGVAEGCQPVRLAAGDYIEVWVYNYAATVTVNDSPLGTWITISQVDTIVTAQTAGSTSVPSATFTKVPHTNENFDTGGDFDGPNATFHPAQNGDYQFCSWLTWSTLSYGGEIDLYVNNTREAGLGDAIGAHGGCRSVRLVANDAVDIRMYQATGGTVNRAADSIWDWLAITKIPGVFSVETIGAMSVPNATFTKIPYATEIFDDGGRFDVGTSTFTAATAGDYLFCAAADANPAGGDVELDLFKNGARDKAFVWGRGGITGCTVLRLAAADQVDVRIWHNGGGTVTTFGGNGTLWWWFQASKIP
jgi:hypothetical protein